MTRPARNPQPRPLPRPSNAIAIPAQPAGELTPLQWLLHVVNDPSASEARRDRAAIAAAPYCHPRPLAVGKKQREARAAKDAGVHGEWGGDLQVQ